jgi:molybdenum cofactor guanylyltransferase
MNRCRITGIVLAGGRSSRMGQDKSLMSFNGRPLISYAIEILRTVCDQVVISSNQEVYEFTGCAVWPDILPLQAPMIGIYSCLKRSQTFWNIFLSCDMPRVDPRLFDYLFSRRAGAEAVIPVNGNKMEPLCGLYSRKALPLLEKKIREGEFSMQQLIGVARSRLVEMSPELGFYSDSLFVNMNTADDIHLFSKK